MLEVLEILRSDAQASPERISDLTGLPVEQIRAQIASWEQSGVIRRYKTVIDHDKLRELEGTDTVTALIDVSVAPSRGVGFDDVAARISRFPDVRAVYLISGTQDLRCIVSGNTMRTVADFVAQKLATIERVRSTSTHFVLKTYKDDGELFLDPEPDRRLPVIP
ncbi:Lrp/AsnC family transcriptional regulator [Pseudofrankia sp. BMG5.37]|uniref:Lrp/AsnC family transcriptional regulator n=1 Tax=Pseudofrankia sp. BMG5.37 TaxID=3050035 RepID=UPI002894CBD3|nr:Lrp/AsnC family transcriptional regulator [Pseudofrankia sp. BMG5.37]MDT3438519.1 Lrp/AsnC family transcriptional regulator [Pseudofrankia sp. BMG5.37]